MYPAAASKSKSKIITAAAKSSSNTLALKISIPPGVAGRGVKLKERVYTSE
jgi:hypothetical protein